MRLEIKGDGWTAECLFTDNPDVGQFMHIEARIDGSTKDTALAGAKTILSLFAAGRTAVIRVEPEAQTYRDFDMKKDFHRGYVRFSYLVESERDRWKILERPSITKFVPLSAIEQLP